MSVFVHAQGIKSVHAGGKMQGHVIKTAPPGRGFELISNWPSFSSPLFGGSMNIPYLTSTIFDSKNILAHCEP